MPEIARKGCDLALVLLLLEARALPGAQFAKRGRLKAPDKIFDWMFD
jgi:hypothetical protein